MKETVGKYIVLWIAMAVWAAPGLAQVAPFKVGQETIAPGTVRDLTLAVAAGQHDPATHIPVTVIHSDKEGPVLLVVTGVHGFEFAPILAAKELAAQMTPDTIKGTLVLVRAANVAAFEERSPYVSPYDRKNLNRSFPGTPDGTQTERIAYHLSHDLIRNADIVLDVHSGDGAEWLAPFIGVYGGPLATNYALALDAAKNSGFENIVTYQMKTQEQIDRGRSLNRQAVDAKKPTLLIEAGQNGERDPNIVRLLVRAVKNIMVRLNMVDDSFKSPAAENIHDFVGTFSVPAPETGVWSPTVKAGQPVTEGQVLGTLYDYFGEEVAVIKAPAAGYALYGLAGPPVRKGQGLITIARFAENAN